MRDRVLEQYMRSPRLLRLGAGQESWRWGPRRRVSRGLQVGELVEGKGFGGEVVTGWI
jgi:hypothetical protein